MGGTMKKGHRQGVSGRKVKELWAKVRTAFDYAKMCDYVLHPLHVDVLTLLVFSLTTWAGWFALGWLLACYLGLRLWQKEFPVAKDRRPQARNHKKCKPPKPAARKVADRRKRKVVKVRK
jgi:hypothetical protein